MKSRSFSIKASPQESKKRGKWIQYMIYVHHERANMDYILTSVDEEELRALHALLEEYIFDNL